MLAESHQNKMKTLQLIKFFEWHQWKAIASPARPTERSEHGNTAGVVVATKNFLDTRPPSIALDAEGKLTGNAQLTGRLLSLSWVEIFLPVGYVESSVGFEGANHNFLMDLDFITRGGKVPFILGIDANEIPEAWLKVSWGDKDFLARLEADIVVARNSNITCTGALNEDGGRNIDYFIISYALLGMITDFGRTSRFHLHLTLALCWSWRPTPPKS